MGLSDSLRKQSDCIWRKILAHPFVRGLGDGSLAVDRFAFYLRQDYLFLIEYGRVLALAAAKAPDLAGMRRFSQLMHATLTEEMELHRRYCAGFGISAGDLERTRTAQATSAYTNFLLSAAYGGSIREIAAVLLPCQWGYCEIGLHLASTGDTSEANRYGEWIRTYSSPAFQELAAWLRGYLDHHGRRISREERRRLGELFRTSSRYEYLFWDMGYRKETWPV
ncbi:MAG: thiaminase II [Dehalococcoidia bacterium]